MPNLPSTQCFVGLPQGTDGNVLIIGGNGSGKSSGIAKPTLAYFQGAICVTDIKGELSDCYEQLSQNGCVTRPYLVFDPTDPEGPSYDPFGWLMQDNENSLIENLYDIAFAMLPEIPNDNQPFWANMERNAFMAALLYYFKLGLSFSEAITMILSQPISELCEKMAGSNNLHINIFLGEIAAMKPETLANIDAGLRSKLALFVNDPYISHAFRGSREGAVCFAWKDLDTHNIFLRIPEDKIEVWSGAFNLMYSQLIRYLERRPEQYRAEGKNHAQVLLLMDEFARFGKLERMTSAMSTLRSKGVNIFLIIQSIAQLDKIYGEHDRRIIFDNCQFQAILRASDSDTQKYLSERIGTCIRIQRSKSKHTDRKGKTTGYNLQASEVREMMVQPHELATLEDVILLSPYGLYQVNKIGPTDAFGRCLNTKRHTKDPDILKFFILDKRNRGATIMSVENRKTNAEQRVITAMQSARRLQQNKKKERERRNQRRNFMIGDLVTKYFPSVKTIEPGTPEENLRQFEKLEAILYILSTDVKLLDVLKNRAAQLIADDPNGQWRLF